MPEEVSQLENGKSSTWQNYWRTNPVNAWIGRNREKGRDYFFKIVDERFTAGFSVPIDNHVSFSDLVQEVTDFRLAAYEMRQKPLEQSDNVISIKQPSPSVVELPFFPNLQVACGTFKAGFTNAEEYRTVSRRYGALNLDRHFIARASGNSMNGGENPIRDGDYLLLEYRLPSDNTAIDGKVIVLERRNETEAENQYLLRRITTAVGGGYILKANNSAYEDIQLVSEMHSVAELKAVIDPLELLVGRPIMREDIPPLFDEVFNPGSWNIGHVVLKGGGIHILLVTLNKQGKAEDHRYLDHWIDEKTFHWQSQNATSPASKRGKEIIEQDRLGTEVHLFVRESKLSSGKAAPFIYHGTVLYQSHSGSNPMSIVFRLNSTS